MFTTTIIRKIPLLFLGLILIGSVFFVNHVNGVKSVKAEVSTEVDQEFLLTLVSNYLYKPIEYGDDTIMQQIWALSENDEREFLHMLAILGHISEDYALQIKSPSALEEPLSSEDAVSSFENAITRDDHYLLVEDVITDVFSGEQKQSANLSGTQLVYYEIAYQKLQELVEAPTVEELLSNGEITLAESILDAYGKYNLPLFAVAEDVELFKSDLETIEKERSQQGSLIEPSTRASCLGGYVSCNEFVQNDFPEIYKRPSNTGAYEDGSINGWYVNQGLTEKVGGGCEWQRCDQAVAFLPTSRYGNPASSPFRGVYLDGRTPAGNCVVNYAGVNQSEPFPADRDPHGPNQHVKQVLIGGGTSASCGLYNGNGNDLAAALKIVWLNY